MKYIIKGSLVAIIVIGFISGYYVYQIYYPSTDDAYIGTNLLDVTPKVSGFVQNIYVENNQFVHKGQILLEINPEDYTVNLEKAQNNKQYEDEQINAAEKSIAVAQANLQKVVADYQAAKKLAERYRNLYRSNSTSVQDYQNYQTKLQIALEQVKQNQGSLEQAKALYKGHLAQLAVAQNNIKEAENYTSYTKLIAPVDGYVTNLNLVKGQLVKTGEPIFGFIDNSNWWVDANFKETQLSRVKAGQNVDIKLDMYNHTYHGIVKSISYASGNTFALLPSENATGNWVKVTQRFTVRILLNNNDINHPLRVGASSNVIIRTRS